MNRRLFAQVVGIIVGAAAHAGRASHAAANEEWCMADPAVPIKTPGGATVVVYLSEYALGTSHRDALGRATHEYTVSQRGRAATDVELTVHIPSEPGQAPFRTRAAVFSGPSETGQLLASREGFSGEPLVLRFTLDVA